MAARTLHGATAVVRPRSARALTGGAGRTRLPRSLTASAVQGGANVQRALTDAEHDGHARAQPAHPHHQPHSARALPRVLLTPEEAAQALGISRSKLYGLRWADVNMTTRSLHLVRQLKTKSSRRQVLLPRIAAEALTAHRARQAVERTHAGTAWEDHGLVFTNTLGGPLHPRNFLLRDFYPLLGRAGLPQMRVPRPLAQRREAAARARHPS